MWEWRAWHLQLLACCMQYPNRHKPPLIASCFITLRPLARLVRSYNAGCLGVRCLAR